MPVIYYENSSDVKTETCIVFIERRPSATNESQYRATIRLLTSPQSILNVFTGEKRQVEEIIQHLAATSHPDDVNYIVIPCSRPIINRVNTIENLWGKWRYVFLNADFDTQSWQTVTYQKKNIPLPKVVSNGSMRVNQWREQIKKQDDFTPPNPPLFQTARSAPHLPLFFSEEQPIKRAHSAITPKR